MHRFHPALAAALLTCGTAVAQTSYEHVLDPVASTITFGGSTSVGPIQGVPTDTLSLDGTFVVDVGFAAQAAASGAFAGGDAITIPGTFSAIVPNPLPFLPPLASMAFSDLHLSLGSPTFAVAGDGSFAVDAVLTIVSGSVLVTPITGGATTLDLAGTVTDPQPVTGTLVVEPARIHTVVALNAAIAFDDPGSGITGTVTLVGTLDGEKRLVQAFCFGDGSGTACPCGNESAAGAESGCLNSFGTGGKLVGTGVASVGADTFLLAGSDMPPSATALYFQANQAAGGGAGTLFGDGLLCASGGVVRLGARFNVGGASSFPPPATNPLSVRGNIPASGATRRYQIWYRNAAAAFCPPAGFNVTNGLEVTWIP